MGLSWHRVPGGGGPARRKWLGALSGAVGHCQCRAWVLLKDAHGANTGACGTRLLPGEHNKQPRGKRPRSTACQTSFGGLKPPSLSGPVVSLVPLGLLQKTEPTQLSQLSPLGETPLFFTAFVALPWALSCSSSSLVGWRAQSGHSTPGVASQGRISPCPSGSTPSEPGREQGHSPLARVPPEPFWLSSGWFRGYSSPGAVFGISFC